MGKLDDCFLVDEELWEFGSWFIRPPYLQSFLKDFCSGFLSLSQEIPKAIRRYSIGMSKCCLSSSCCVMCKGEAIGGSPVPFLPFSI